MPKQFGYFNLVRVIGVGGLALCFIGCRSTANRLASIPGMGWLDRSDKSLAEGWAGFEPRNDIDSELPPPSFSEEPTRPGSASSLADKGKAKSRSNTSELAKQDRTKSESTDDFTPRYYGNSTKENTDKDKLAGRYNSGSTYGNYDANLKSTVKSVAEPQQGLYGGGSTSGESRNDSRSDSLAKSRYGVPKSNAPLDSASDSIGKYASSSGYGDTVRAAAGDAIAYTADRASRFGGVGAAAGSVDSSNQPVSGGAANSYSPPGFPRGSGELSSNAAKLTQNVQQGITSAADEIKSAAESDIVEQGAEAAATMRSNVQSQVQSRWNDAAQQVSEYLPGPPAAESSLSNLSTAAANVVQGVAAPVADSVMENVGGVANRFTSTAQQQLGTAAEKGQTLVDQAQTTTHGYIDATRNTVSNLQGQVSQYGANVQGQMSQYGAKVINQFAESVRTETPVGGNSAPSQPLQGVADAAKGYFQAAQQGYYQAQQAIAPETNSTSAGNVPAGSIPAGNITSGIPGNMTSGNASAGAPNSTSYPTTSTPQAFLPGTEPVGRENSAPIGGPDGGANPASSWPTNSGSSLRRSDTPWQPGSTGRFQQGASVVVPARVELTSYRRMVESEEVKAPLKLAVGDVTQFPRDLR